MNDDAPKIKVVKGDDKSTPPKPLSDYEIGMIHAGLMRPGARQILSMSREIRKWRGDPNPDRI